MAITINLLSRSDTKELLEFEKENRDFFESTLPSRGDDYYNIDYLNKMIEEIEKEQEEGQYYLYLIRNKNNEIVGRVNLFSIVRGIFQKAEIGYRIGKRHNGKGYATEAVRLACKEAFEKYNLHRIEAGTSRKNIGSQIVLVKNKFEFVGKNSQVIKINGKWQDGVLFERLKEEGE